MRRFLKTNAFFFVIGLGSFFHFSCKEEAQTAEIKQITIEFKKEGELILKKSNNDSLLAILNIEIADDDYQTQTGLMYRNSMKDNEAMLFVFPDEDYRSFYMKNTKFPLDIIYISEDKKVVSIQENAQPMLETSLPSDAPAKYVLEVNAGLAKAWQLRAGDTMEFYRK